METFQVQSHLAFGTWLKSELWLDNHQHLVENNKMSTKIIIKNQEAQGFSTILCTEDYPVAWLTSGFLGEWDRTGTQSVGRGGTDAIWKSPLDDSCTLCWRSWFPFPTRKVIVCIILFNLHFKKIWGKQISDFLELSGGRTCKWAQRKLSGTVEVFQN